MRRMVDGTLQEATPAPRRRRAYSLNLIRVSLFVLVLFVHSAGSINWDPVHYQGMQFFTMLVHCARYGFVFVTGFVLFLAYYRSPIGTGTFWRRRFGFVLWPYLAWTVIYLFVGYWLYAGAVPGAGTVASDIGWAVLRGDAKYQLYFLLISMQIYLFFPVLRALLRRTEGRHGRVLAGAAVLQAAVFCTLSLWHPGLEWYGHMWKTLPTYALFLVGGALAGVHYDRFAPWVRARGRALLLPAAAGMTLSIVLFFVISDRSRVPELAYAAYSIQNLPYYLGVVALFYIGAQAWEDRRGDGTGRFARLVDHASVRAFGIFAVHPLVLDMLRRIDFIDWLYRTFPGSTVPRTIVLGLATLVATLALVEVILHTPLSRVLVARDRIPLRRAPRPAAPAEQSAARQGPAEQDAARQGSAEQAPAAPAAPVLPAAPARGVPAGRAPAARPGGVPAASRGGHGGEESGRDERAAALSGTR